MSQETGLKLMKALRKGIMSRLQVLELSYNCLLGDVVGLELASALSEGAGVRLQKLDIHETGLSR